MSLHPSMLASMDVDAVLICETESPDPPPGDVRRTWADLTRARSLLGYEPKTTIENGLLKFVEWLHDNAHKE